MTELIWEGKYSMASDKARFGLPSGVFDCS